VAFDVQTGRYLVLWSDWRNTYNDIYGQFVNEKQTLDLKNVKDENGDEAVDSADNFPVFSSATEDQDYPSAAASPLSGNFLSAFGTVVDWNMSIYGYDRTGVGVSDPVLPGLYYIDRDMDGITTTSGSDYTFRVYYIGPAAPSKTQLWIDMNGDGSFSAGIPVLFFTSTTGIFILMILGLAAIYLVFFKRTRLHRFIRPAFGLGAFILMVFIFFGMTGCGGKEGSDETEKEAETSELFTMTEVDSGDTTYKDGKLYTVTVSITDSGTYTYSFVFTDSEGTAATGIPALENTLTVP